MYCIFVIPENLYSLTIFTYTVHVFTCAYREFGITLERKESEEVNGLRTRWNELSDTANRVSINYLHVHYIDMYMYINL